MKKTVCAIILIVSLGAGLVFQGAAAFASEDETVQLEKVHGLYWNAKLRKSVKKGKEVLAKAGSRVIVTNRNYKRSGKSEIMVDSGERVKVPTSWLSIRSDHTTIVQEGDYNTATKEAFINSKAGVRAKERYLIWISLDKQRVNIFVPSENRWKLYRCYPCSSGKAQTPTKTGWARVDFKRRSVKGLKWYTDVSGGGMHKWPGKLNRKQYGIHVASKGCVRLTEKDAHEVYRMIPVRTRILVY